MAGPESIKMRFSFQQSDALHIIAAFPLHFFDHLLVVIYFSRSTVAFVQINSAEKREVFVHVMRKRLRERERAGKQYF